MPPRPSPDLLTRIVTGLCALIAGTAAVIFEPVNAHANWLTRILSEAGDAGKSAGLKGAQRIDGDLGRATHHLQTLPDTPGLLRFAAEAGPEGHWRFADRNGDTFTAANPAELQRLRETLAPGRTGTLDLYLTPQTVFDQRANLDQLPADARLNVVTRTSAHRIVRDTLDGTAGLYAEIRPGVRLAMEDETLFHEALFQLARPLKPANTRIIALEPGSADALPRLPQFDPSTKGALVDRIEPQRLAQSLRSISSQTIVLTGRIDGAVLKYQPARGGDGSLPLDGLRAAARDADVDLVIVRSNAPRQPGGRNWLWQTTSIPGLDAAVQQPTFGDFLAAIGSKSSPLTVRARAGGTGQAILDVTSAPGTAVPLGETLSDWVDMLSGETIGRITVAGIEAHVVEAERKRELDLRIVPGIPAAVQMSYLAALAMSLFGPMTGWRWWGRLWPPERRDDYAGLLGYVAARAARILAFLLIFLPLAGLPLLVRFLALQIWAILSAPMRLWRWLLGRFRPQPG